MKPCIFVVALIVLSSTIVMAEDWPRLNGPHTNWISNDKGLADSWPKEGPKTAWAVTNLGGGFGSPVVAGGRVFVIGRQVDLVASKDKHGNMPGWNDVKCLPGSDVLTCLDRKDGKVIWKHEFNSVSNSASTAWNTPTVDGNVLYARGGDGEVRCVSVKDGETVWIWPKQGEEAFKEKNKGLASGSGCAASITVCDDLLVFKGSLGILVGLNRKTGEKAWETGVQDWQHGDRNHVVLDLGNSKKALLTQNMVLDPLTGKKTGQYLSPGWGYWSEWCSGFEGNRYYGGICRSILPTNSPYYAPESVGHGQGLECLAFESKDDGSVVATSKWQWFTDHKADFKGKNNYPVAKGFTGPLIVDKYLYAFVGRKGDVIAMTCLDAGTGKQTWPDVVRIPHLGFTCPVYADGKIFYINDSGLLVMIAADSKEYRLLGTANVVGKTWSSVALSDGFAFVRDDLGMLKCLDLRVTK